MGGCIIRLRRNCTPIAGDRFDEPALAVEYIAEIKMGLCVIRLQVNRFSKACGGFANSPGRSQCKSKIVLYVRNLGIQSQCVVEITDCRLVGTRLKSNGTE